MGANQDTAIGSCFFTHRWSKWAEKDVTMIRKNSNEEFEYNQPVQTRYCKKCGKIQYEKIRFS